nr:transposase, Ptta/En/Spm [Tanacetum cinerariifolium]
MDNSVSIRVCNDSQQAGYVLELGLTQPDDGEGIAKKQTLLDILNDRFDLPPGSDDWILNSFRNKVKSWRARVKKDYYDPSLSFHDQINSKPKQVRLGDWNKLVRSWNIENSK